MKKFFLVALYIFILECSFAIHEYGHLKEFQRLNVSVEEFSLGIGPVIYQYKTDSYFVSFRLIPIMAYVLPTEEGWKFFNEHCSPLDKIAVNTAGVRNNFLAGLIIIIFLQFLGWQKNNVSTKEFFRIIIITPFKILFLFFSFLLSCATLGSVNPTERFLISTCGIDPPKLIKKIIFFNFILGILNLSPVPPLDGGHMAQNIFAAFGIDYLTNIPKFIGAVIFFIFLTIANKQKLRVLKVELLDDWKEEEEGFFDDENEVINAPFPIRLRYLLMNSEIKTIGELKKYTEKQLSQIKGMTPESIVEIKKFLFRYHLSLRPDEYPVMKNPMNKKYSEKDLSATKNDPTSIDRWKEEIKEIPDFILELNTWSYVNIGFPSFRVKKILKNFGIETIGELRQCTKEQLLRIDGFGKKSLDEVEKFLDNYKLSLKPDETL